MQVDMYYYNNFQKSSADIL